MGRLLSRIPILFWGGNIFALYEDRGIFSLISHAFIFFELRQPFLLAKSANFFDISGSLSRRVSLWADKTVSFESIIFEEPG
jgi:hypothetical protein